MDDLYRDYILEHYKRPKNFGELEPHDLEAHDHNPLCGDEMGVHIRVDDGKIAELRFHGQGCAISQAATSMLTEIVVGPQGVCEEALVTATHACDWLGVRASGHRLEFTVVIFFPWHADKRLFAGERIHFSGLSL